ncbi:MAG TPA: succinate dehydrogenase, cytochrome b556 subunit [Geminicoccaceae bacterium]|nr:succinate dehydrogenase, cytochrome b556 subunit [Geminicoccaceae bacterium]
MATSERAVSPHRPASARPLSPHLQISRWYLSMALSIAHRITGIGLVLGLLFLTWWLVALAGGEAAYVRYQWWTGNPLGVLVLFGFSIALFFHLCTGIRHLVWDFGWGYELHIAKQTGMAVLVATAVLTVLTWLAVLIVA